jgi:hypothetical protein
VEQRADRLAGQRPGGQVGGGEHHRDAESGRDPGRLDLGHHAAGPDPSGAAQRDADEVAVAPNLREPARTWLPRITVVQPVDIREQHQPVGADEVRDQGRQSIVVTEPDLVGRDRVVLVDDGHDSHAEQLFERTLRVAMVDPAHHVVGGE